MYALVAIARPMLSALTYYIPSELSGLIKPGSRVVVSLGRRLETGWVVSLQDKTDLDLHIIKPVLNLVDREPLFGSDLIELFRWTAEYYIVSPGYVFKAAMPPGISDSPDFIIEITPEGLERARSLEQKSKPSKPERILNYVNQKGKCNIKEIEKETGLKEALKYCYSLEKDGLIRIEQVLNVREDYLLRRPASILSDKFKTAPKAALESCGKAPVQRQVLEYLEGRTEPVLNNTIMSSLNISAGAIDALCKKGLITRVEMEQERDTLYPPWDGPLKGIPELSSEQQAAADAVLTSMETGECRTFLLHGITGSGKTEVYLYLCHKLIHRNAQTLVLVPEISLTPQLYRRFQEHFGARIALLHSGLSAGERFEQWLKAKRGQADVVIGTRSAIFSPLDQLSLIIVDEEQDGSYKQEESPRYNARDLAVKRAGILKIPALLGSATPSVESYYNAQQGKYSLLEIKKRYGVQGLPAVTIVDMREEFKRVGIQQEISGLLDDKIKEKMAAGEQALILINRRGYRSRLLCRECGRIALCRYCNAAMKYHRSIDRLVCHFCDYRKPLNDRCDYCNGELIEFVGIGTERVEEILKKDFRSNTVMRMDQDTTGTRGSHYRILEMLRRGEIDILVGTQMIAKGHDYPRVTLVGVVSAESILALPDFRHSEKTFQLLTQAAGRSGRGESPGEVIIQTFSPDHYSIRFAREHDYVGFYKEEIFFRERLSHPPFTGIAVIRFESKDKAKAYANANKFKNILDELHTGNISMRGPKSAPLSKLRAKHRIQLIVKSRLRSELNDILKTAVDRAYKEGISVGDYVIDIDPYNLM